MSCVDINNKLYYNLVNLCDTQDQAKNLYAKIVNPEFIEDYKIKTDKNGIPVFKDVYKKAKLGKQIKHERKVKFLEGQLNARTLSNTATNVNRLCEEVTIFNNENDVNDYVAVIETNGGTITSKVVRKNHSTDVLSKQIKTNANLNNFLKGKLMEIGVGVGSLTRLEERRGIAGVTEFERAKDATNGIAELIRIAKNKKGEQALPEEFAHFAIEALGENNQLVTRMYNTMTDEMVEAVLGEQYERYANEYNNDSEALKTEALGKLLAEYIKAEYTGVDIAASGLLTRIRNAVMNKFKNLNEFEFEKALIDLDETLYFAAKELLYSDLLKKVGLTNIRSSQSYYSQEHNKVKSESIPIEMQSIKEKAIADGTFMKAPNGEPTNLTEQQWLLVRTKAFKEWFGDWEFGTRIVNIIKAAKEHGFKNFEEAKRWAKNNIVGAYNNPEIGEVNVSNTSLEKMLSGKAVAKSDNTDVHLSALKVLPQIIENSIVGEVHEDRNNDTNIKDIVRLFGCVNINGKNYRTKTTVKRYANVNDKTKAYSYEITEIELLDGENGTPHTQSADFAPTSNNSITIAKLLKDVKKTNNPNENIFDCSEAIDMNGEPLLYYANTNKSKKYFEDDSISYIEDYNEKIAYGEDVEKPTIQPAFLNVKGNEYPIIVDNTNQVFFVGSPLDNSNLEQNLSVDFDKDFDNLAKLVNLKSKQSKLYSIDIDEADLPDIDPEELEALQQKIEAADLENFDAEKYFLGENKKDSNPTDVDTKALTGYTDEELEHLAAEAADLENFDGVDIDEESLKKLEAIDPYDFVTEVDFNIDDLNGIDLSEYEQQDIDFEGLQQKNDKSFINFNRIKADFIKDVEQIKDDLKTEGVLDQKSKIFIAIESSLNKLNLLNNFRGVKNSNIENETAIFEYLYTNKNMLANILYFVYNSIETLNNQWNDYDKNKFQNVNQRCQRLLAFSNTVSALEYLINSPDTQNIMDVVSMNFEKDADKRINDVLKKYLAELTYNLNVTKQFIQNEELLVTKAYLTETFGEKFTIPLTLSDTKELTLDNELASGTQKDVGILTRWFSSLANSPSLILKMVDQIVKKSNDNRRNRVFETKRRILALGKEYEEKTGNKDFSWMFERTDGKRTGYYIGRYNRDLYYKAYAEMVTSHKNEYVKKGKFDVEVYQAYRQAFEERRKKENDWKNPDWDKLTRYQQDFVERYVSLKQELDKLMFAEAQDFDMDDPEDVDTLHNTPKGNYKFNSYKTIKIEKSLINKLRSAKTAKEMFAEMKRALREKFVKTSSDTDLTENKNSKAYLTDFNENRVYDIPRLFTTKQEDESEENMTLDPISSLVAYADAAINRNQKMQIVGLINVITDIVNRRKLAETKGDNVVLKKLKTHFGEINLPIVRNAKESNISKMLRDYVESQIYGMWNVDMGEFGNSNVSKDKMINAALSQTAITGMALNVLGGISNVATGKAMMRIESICSQFFTYGETLKADKEYAKHLPKILSQAGELFKDDKLGLLIEQLNILQDYEQEILHVEADTNNFLRCCSQQGLFILNNIGEHYLQSRTALAVAFNTKVKDKNGKEITLWDALEVLDIDEKKPELGKKVWLKEGVTDLDGNEIKNVEKYLNKYTHKVAAINQRMHGIYNYEDRCAAQRYAVGRLFYQFRKYIPVSLQRRFATAQFNFDLDTATEGYYVTFGKFLKKSFIEMKNRRATLLQVWKSMNEMERKNCMRSIVEIAQTLLVFGAFSLLEWAMGDKKKQSPWATKMLDYQARRLYSEMAAMTPSLGMLNEALKIIDSPFAACRIMDKNIDILGALNPFNYGEDSIITQGKYKGHYKGTKSILQALPIYSSMINLFDPYEATKFYKN